MSSHDADENSGSSSSSVESGKKRKRIVDEKVKEKDKEDGETSEEESEEDDSDEEDGGIKIVLDAPTSASYARAGKASNRGLPSASASGASAPEDSDGLVSAGGGQLIHPFRLPYPNDVVFELDLDLMSDDQKGWKKAGADISDWFNYGFDEQTFRAYAYKQISQRRTNKQWKQTQAQAQQLLLEKKGNIPGSASTTSTSGFGKLDHDTTHAPTHGSGPGSIPPPASSASSSSSASASLPPGANGNVLPSMGGMNPAMLNPAAIMQFQAIMAMQQRAGVLPPMAGGNPNPPSSGNAPPSSASLPPPNVSSHTGGSVGAPSAPPSRFGNAPAASVSFHHGAPAAVGPPIPHMSGQGPTQPGLYPGQMPMPMPMQTPMQGGGGRVSGFGDRPPNMPPPPFGNPFPGQQFDDRRRR